MTLLVASVLVAFLAAGIVIYPILAGRWGILGDAVPGRVVDSETRKRVALAALKEVEYDHAAGKLDEADYRAMRSQLEVEALTAVKTAQSEAAAVEASRGPITHACGFVNPAESRFCAGCGQRLA